MLSLYGKISSCFLVLHFLPMFHEKDTRLTRIFIHIFVNTTKFAQSWNISYVIIEGLDRSYRKQ